ncbi:MAG: peroxiredoxin, partial [Acidobacteria bacterium]|nr:peroxiredoxin [Acidobacteriota bacterium]
MDGIGSSHFPITTSNPEVQQWFDQGHTLIHSFWYYEAERAFRWCLKLDPNAAMAYWGLARSYYWRERDIDREAAFMREASKRKDRVSDRERLYIEAWEELYTPEAIVAQRAGGAPADEVRRRLRGRLEQIIRKYPDDLEAKALFAWEARGLSSRGDIEATLQQILAKIPDHPGAHHYRIHIWDGREAERSLDSALAYGRTVPAIG